MNLKNNFNFFRTLPTPLKKIISILIVQRCKVHNLTPDALFYDLKNCRTQDNLILNNYIILVLYNAF